MSVLRIIAKILLIPVVVVLTVIQWIGIFLNSISGVILGVLAFIFALTRIVSLTFRLVSGSEAMNMITAGFVIFMVPVMGEGFVERIMTLRRIIDCFIRSE